MTREQPRTRDLRLGKTAGEGAQSDAATVNVRSLCLKPRLRRRQIVRPAQLITRQFSPSLLLSGAHLLSLAEVAARLP